MTARQRADARTREHYADIVDRKIFHWNGCARWRCAPRERRMMIFVVFIVVFFAMPDEYADRADVLGERLDVCVN